MILIRSNTIDFLNVSLYVVVRVKAEITNLIPYLCL